VLLCRRFTQDARIVGGVVWIAGHRISRRHPGFVTSPGAGAHCRAARLSTEDIDIPDAELQLAVPANGRLVVEQPGGRGEIRFLSRMTIERGAQPGMSTGRKRLFIGLSHNAALPAAYFWLPVDGGDGSRVEL
jgi:hypothetical protein